MTELEKHLAKEIKKMSGKIITIGLNDSLFRYIENNSAITECMSMNSTIYDKSDSRGFFSFNKTLSANKLRKKFKKKKHTNLIMNIKHIEKNIKTVIRDSIYITKDNVYIYGAKKDFDVDLLKKRYKRYKVDIDYTEYKNSYVMKIDVKKAKNNKIKDIFYYLGDTIHNGIELFSDFLVN